MAYDRKSETAGKFIDKETHAMIYEGVSLAQLQAIFNMDATKIKKRLGNLQPSSTRGGHPIFSLKEAAALIVDPPYPIEEWIKHMNHADLPVLLKKEYWAGMRSRQIYEQAAGDLWSTDKVIEHVSEILKVVSMSIRLSSDTVDREIGLTPAQRTLVIRLNDEALANAHRELEKMLKERKETANANRATAFDDEL